MTTCKTCKNWTPFNEVFVRADSNHPCSAGGVCTSPNLIDDDDYETLLNSKSMAYICGDGGYFWSGPEFGCVNHTQKE